VVGGTTGAAAYVAIYDSVTENQVCEAAFVPIDPADPLHAYDQGHVFGVVFGNGGFYAVGEAHDTTSTPDNFDAFIQRFDGACQKADPATGPVIVGGPDHDAFKGVTVSAAGVFAAGYIHLLDDDQFLAERWSADLATNAYAFFYPITGTAGGNHWNTVASDAAGNAWTLGYLHLTAAATDQRLEENRPAPDGSVTAGQVFFASDSGPSEYTSVKRGGDNLMRRSLYQRVNLMPIRTFRRAI